MKNKTYRFGLYQFKACQRTVGHGYEISLTFDKKTLFVGNFIHRDEANRWWGMMNREINTFTKTFWLNKKVNKVWYGNFCSNHLYKTYYKFLDKLFTKYNKTYTKAVTRDTRKYRTMKKRFVHTDKTTYRAA